MGISMVTELEQNARQQGVEPLYVEAMTHTDFLNAHSLEGVEEIWIQAHTGQYLINNLIQCMSREGFYHRPRLKVLLRSPYWENQRRYRQLFFTVKGLREQLEEEGIRINIRFYQKAPKERLMCFKYTDGRRIAFVSEYTQAPQKKSHAWARGMVIQDEDSLQGRSPFLEMRLDAFRHHWGHEELHTLIFDFDDTLFETSHLQIEAWGLASRQLLAEGFLQPGWLAKDFLAALASEKEAVLSSYLTQTFFRQQMAARILSALFPQVPMARQEALYHEINERRYRIREALTKENAQPFPGVMEMLQELANRYQLIIVSSTAEKLIRQLLTKYGLRPYFSDIFGKFGPSSDWENIKSKAEKVLKIASSVGVPLSRMVFFGDNNTDFKSAKQVNLAFVENAMVAEKHGLGSLLDTEEGEEVLRITSWEADQWREWLQVLNQQLADSKYQLPEDFTRD